jgi:sugar/nucleoside kinase (ribokinase family)
VGPRPAGAPDPVDVVGLGSNALDLVGVIDGYPEPDTKSPLREFEVQGGGMIATAMVTCARLGLRARYVGKFGDDYWARLGRRLLARDGVDVRHALRARGSVGHVTIMLVDARTGLRTGFYRRPPAYAIQPDELDRGVITSGRLLHVDGVDAAAAAVAVRWAREAGIRVTMDGERVVEGIDAVWPAVDLLVCNPRFVAQVTGRARVEQGLIALAARGPARVAVTPGGGGRARSGVGTVRPGAGVPRARRRHERRGGRLPRRVRGGGAPRLAARVDAHVRQRGGGHEMPRPRRAARNPAPGGGGRVPGRARAR